MLIHTEAFEGFDIHFYALAEESSFSDWFEGQDDVADDIASGRLSWFTAKVQAFKNGIPLASAFLGACAYKNASDFVTQDGYYADMRATVAQESREMIAKGSDMTIYSRFDPFTLDNTNGFTQAECDLLNQAVGVLMKRGIDVSNACDIVTNNWQESDNTVESLTARAAGATRSKYVLIATSECGTYRETLVCLTESESDDMVDALESDGWIVSVTAEEP